MLNYDGSRRKCPFCSCDEMQHFLETWVFPISHPLPAEWCLPYTHMGTPTPSVSGVPVFGGGAFKRVINLNEAGRLGPNLIWLAEIWTHGEIPGLLPKNMKTEREGNRVHAKERSGQKPTPLPAPAPGTCSLHNCEKTHCFTCGTLFWQTELLLTPCVSKRRQGGSRLLWLPAGAFRTVLFGSACALQTLGSVLKITNLRSRLWRVWPNSPGAGGLEYWRRGLGRAVKGGLVKLCVWFQCADRAKNPPHHHPQFCRHLSDAPKGSLPEPLGYGCAF